MLTSDLVLAIETSCDDSAAAVVAGGRRVLSSIVASQDDVHSLFGGVVPEVASRKHVEVITAVVQRALDEAGVTWGDLGGLAVTHGPGLIGSLLVGVAAAKAYQLSTGLPLVGVNHIDSHLNSNFCDTPDYEGAPEDFPAVCLVASGGHSDLSLMLSRSEHRVLGCTRDDAAGEALDKAARLLKLGYPGGPAIQKAAEQGTPRFDLPRPIIEGTFDFSFSGLKTAILRLIQQLEKKGEPLPVNDLAASFQQAVVDTLVRNVREAAQQEGARQILLAGGVAANKLLRAELARVGEDLGIPVRYPPFKLCTDNAAMVGAAAWSLLQAGKRDDLALDVFAGLESC
ncbi:MAG: tRNA (adenosine(37)-N6)-threonylcarbamoyltransferase complex transferase subunit TsaD [Armatimonadota bacterium]